MENLGKISKNHDGFQVKFERVFAFDIETVWNAITDPKKLAIWFTYIEMDFKEGGQIMIRFDDAEKTKSYGTILRIIKPNVFEFTWEEELATWELFSESENSCKLVLTYSKLPEEYAAHVPAGWHVLLDQLKTVLNGRKEPYPFGNGETTESQKMKTIYTELAQKEFPFLTPKS